MFLTERTGIPDAVLPVADMRAHLRLGSGFEDDGVQDALVLGYLRAAMAAIEGRTGKALIARNFVWKIAAWRDASGQALPVAPVLSLGALRILDRADVASVVPAGRYRLEVDAHRPRLCPASGVLPTIPAGGRAEVEFEAGFGRAWGDVPADLRQAVMLLAAHFHEFRHEAGVEEGALPFGVGALIERWRNVRVLGGGGR
jgi:uncharacterized phiE125 gp8 family phage protein